MAITPIEYTTGPSVLQDVGYLSYNGCHFSPMFTSRVTGTAVKDSANRNTKYVEYTIRVDGFVTLTAGQDSINAAMTKLRSALTAQGGELVYTGRGWDIYVNTVNNENPNGVSSIDVAWGPVPELIEFQPLGGGRSAKVQWSCKARICEVKGKPIQFKDLFGGDATIPLLEFTFESSVSYGEDGFSSMSYKGTLEIPMSRKNSTIAINKTVPMTADYMRPYIEDKLMKFINLERYRVTRRNFNLSRDKRTLDWDFTIEETAYMDQPAGCTLSRGSYSVRPTKSGAGLCSWICTLRATYTLHRNVSRRTAYIAFLLLMRLRIECSRFGPEVPPQDREDFKPPQPAGRKALEKLFVPGGIVSSAYLLARDALANPAPNRPPPQQPAPRAWIIDFNFDEGLYLDSKTTTFSASWRLVTPMSHILHASGIWAKLPEEDAQGNNLWGTAAKPTQGVFSWAQNIMTPDVIVDFGS